MKNAHVLALGLSISALMACSSNLSDQKSVGPQVLGTINLELSTEGSLKAQTVTTTNGIAVRLVTTGGYPKKNVYYDGARRYITYKFTVSNRSAVPVSNLTFVALNRPTPLATSPATIGGTAFLSIQRVDNTYVTDPSVARSMIPTHGFTPSPSDGVDPQSADLQFLPAIAGYPNALGYGFLAHGPTTGTGGTIERTNSRTINPGQTGDVFVTYRFSNSTNPISKFTIALIVMTDDNTALSESVEDRGGFVTVAGFSRPYFTDGVNARMRYTCESTLDPTNPLFTTNYGLADNFDHLLTAAASGKLKPVYYPDCN